MTSILEMLQKIPGIEVLPFFASVNGKATLNTNRIVEAVIIAAIAAGGSSMMTAKVIETKFDMYIKSNELRIAKMEQQIGKLTDIIYQPVIRQEGGK